MKITDWKHHVLQSLSWETLLKIKHVYTQLPQTIPSLISLSNFSFKGNPCSTVKRMYPSMSCIETQLTCWIWHTILTKSEVIVSLSVFLMRYKNGLSDGFLAAVLLKLKLQHQSFCSYKVKTGHDHLQPIQSNAAHTYGFHMGVSLCCNQLRWWKPLQYRHF